MANLIDGSAVVHLNRMIDQVTLPGVHAVDLTAADFVFG